MDEVDRLLAKQQKFKETGEYPSEKKEHVVDIQDTCTYLSDFKLQPALVTRKCYIRWKKHPKAETSSKQLSEGDLLYYLGELDIQTTLDGKACILHTSLVIGKVTGLIHARVPRGCVRVLTSEEVVRFQGHPQLYGF